jgi:hypothetical protein
MSRFNQDQYQKILHSPYGIRGHQKRASLPAREKKNRIVRRWYHSRLLLATTIVFLLLLVFALLYISDNFENIESVFYGSRGKFFFYFLCSTIVALPFIERALTLKKLSNLIKNRAIMSDDEFTRQIDRPIQVDTSIGVIRDVLGLIFNIDRNKIYPDDKLTHLSVYGNPIQFELVLGVANELNVNLDDKEIDTIGRTVYEKAKTVKELVDILLNFILSNE